MAEAEDPRLTDPEFLAAAAEEDFAPEILAEIIDRLADDDNPWKRQPQDGPALRDAAASARDEASGDA